PARRQVSRWHQITAEFRDRGTVRNRQFSLFPPGGHALFNTTLLLPKGTPRAVLAQRATDPAGRVQAIAPGRLAGARGSSPAPTRPRSKGLTSLVLIVLINPAEYIVSRPVELCDLFAEDRKQLTERTGIRKEDGIRIIFFEQRPDLPRCVRE